jgi:putative addiction module killer protein
MQLRIARTKAFILWFDALRDRKGQTIIARRIERVAGGNLGDVKSLGGGLHELRIAFGRAIASTSPLKAMCWFCC